MCSGLFSDEDQYTFGVLVSISSNRTVYLGLSQNEQQCVFMVMKEYVNSVFNGAWTTMELYGTQE